MPSAPENGAVDVTGVHPIVARYSCYEGTLVGPVIRICLHNASWSGVNLLAGQVIKLLLIVVWLLCKLVS